LGAILVALVVLPLYRLLGPEAGLAGRATIDLSDTTAAVLLYGSLLVIIPALVLSRLIRPQAFESPLRGIGKQLVRPRLTYFALGLAVIAALLTLLFSSTILEGKPNLIDGMAQLVHARYMAAGRLAGPVMEEGAFWHIQNTVITPHGWVSQYPPGHIVLLATGLRLGVLWAVGPFMVAVTVFFTTLIAERLFPGDRATARLGAVFVATSPFMIGLAGAQMNHITASACGAAAVYCALRARDGRASWAVAAGLALGWAFATRPLAALSVGVVVGFGVWLSGGERGAFRVRSWTIRSGLAALGAAPPLIALITYNSYFFGGPLRFGYDIAHGETTRLGFHIDPWGNWYGPLQALAYTSSDLVALSLNLLETPVPVVVVVGLFLITAPRLDTGVRVLAAWALLPVLANLFYWHHGLFMGPRMLNEVAPAWALLTAVAGVGIIRSTPEEWRVWNGKYSIRTAVTSFMLVGIIVGYGLLGPQRMLGYREVAPSSRLVVPETEAPSIVFVHGAWAGRVAMSLAAAGMRLDSMETAIRQNPLCDTHLYAAHLLAGGEGSDRRRGSESAPILDFSPRSQNLPPQMEITPGNRIRVAKRGVLAAECRHEIFADRNGIIDVSPLVWQGDLPGLAARGPLYVRDMGPELNAGLIERFPERTPLVFYTPAPSEQPRLASYVEGMAAIWGDSYMTGEAEW
jgi:hypothetical protein